MLHLNRGDIFFVDADVGLQSGQQIHRTQQGRSCGLGQLIARALYP